MAKYDVVSIGESLIDFTGTDVDGELAFVPNVGGGPLNLVAAVAKFEMPAAMITKISKDGFGIRIYEALKLAGIGLNGVVFSQKNTALAFVHNDSSGDRSFTFYRNNTADLDLSSEEINYKIIEEAKVLHYSSVSMTGNPCREATFFAASYAKKSKTTVSFDPNLRPLLWNSLDDAKAQIEKGLTYTDILKLSEEELQFLTDTFDYDEGTQMLYDKYQIPIILLTLGKKGCYYRLSGITGIMPTYECVETIDTTGAGDGFLGGFLYRFVKLNKSPTSVTEAEVTAAIDFANATGSLVTTVMGGFTAMPELEAVEQLMNS